MRKLKVYGNVVVKQDNEIILSRSNDILANGYRWLCSMWLCASIASVNVGSKLFTMRVGKGSAPNTEITTALATQISTAPERVFGDGVIETQTKFYAVWPVGVLNTQLSGEEKIEEIGLFFGMCNTQATRWTSATWAQNVFSRVVLGEDAFVPDPTKPIVVEWTIGVDFV